MNKSNIHVYITWTPVLRIWLWGVSVLNVAYVQLFWLLAVSNKQPEVVLIQEIVSCTFPCKHIGFFGCCGLVWPACCCSSLVFQSCSSLSGYLCAWEWGQAKCLKGGLPSTSSPMANHVLPKPRNVSPASKLGSQPCRHQCVHSALRRDTVVSQRGWCVYQGKYCMQSAVSPPLQHIQGIVDYESAVRYSWILHADISIRNFDSLLRC